MQSEPLFIALLIAPWALVLAAVFFYRRRKKRKALDQSGGGREGSDKKA